MPTSSSSAPTSASTRERMKTRLPTISSSPWTSRASRRIETRENTGCPEREDGVGLTVPEGDAGLAEVVRGHLHIDLVAHADADEVFAHFSGDMREHLVTVG